MTKNIQEQTFSQYLSTNKNLILSQIKTALPKHLDPDRMLRVLITELKRVQELNNCTIQSVLGAFIQVSQLGLEIGNLLGHAYLIPYGNQCQLIVGYRGMIELARRSGQIISIYAQGVYENDLFEFEFGLEEKLKHVPTKGDRGKFIYAYAIAKLANTFTPDGKIGVQFEVMSKTDIDKIRERSKSGSSEKSPWGKDYDEMAKKTVVRRLFKYLPISIEIQKAINQEEVVEMGGKYEIDDAQLLESFADAPSKADTIANKINLGG